LAPIYINSSGVPTVADCIIDVTTANTDLNDYKTAGFYYFTSNYTPTNVPPNSTLNGILEVITDNGYGTAASYVVKQIWHR